MFGKTIDYHLLKPLTHDRYRATEEELRRRAENSSYSLEEARAYCERARSVFFGGALPLDPELSYLDIGSGMGRLAVGLCAAGAKDVTGVEVVERAVVEAERLAAQLDRIERMARPRFFCRDVHSWDADRQYDVVLVLGAMEHIHKPDAFIKTLPRLMKPEGRAFVSFEPFRSPTGDHMSPFFRVPVPWRGLLFSEQAILKLRRECYRPTDPATRFEEIVGGLNKMSFPQYLRYIEEAGLEVEAHFFNPQVRANRNTRLLTPINWLLTHIPRVQGYFILYGYSILKKARPLA